MGNCKGRSHKTTDTVFITSPPPATPVVEDEGGTSISGDPDTAPPPEIHSNAMGEDFPEPQEEKQEDLQLTTVPDPTALEEVAISGNKTTRIDSDGLDEPIPIDVQGELDKNLCCKNKEKEGEEEGSVSSRLYKELLESEPVLQVEDIQGDCILGFNKRFTRRLVLVLKHRNDSKMILTTKEWLKRFATTGIERNRSKCAVPLKITSLKDVLEHRKTREDLLSRKISICSDETVQNIVFCNISFSHQCLDILLSGTLYAETMRSFDSRDPFVIGAKDRGTLLGDYKYQDSFEFGKNGNDDILINIGSDSLDAIDEATKALKADFKDIFKVVNDTECDRGIKDKNALYGHEHFGFQDGLSQPTVRGTYYNDNMEKEFIVKRTVKASSKDKRYLNYSRPGFRLCDTGHFILGQEYLRSITDDIDPQMSNPNPDVYRKIRGAYPDWCTGGSFTVYRKIQQNVPLFWKTCYKKAESLNKGVSEDELKDKAGFLGAKMIGRWWDGTPLEEEKPLTGLYYPPTQAGSEKILEVKKANAMDGLKNGFQFNSAEEAWKLRNGSKTPGYKADNSGSFCPFAAHIRKVNPRDEFTDIGSDLQTLKHRIIRRGNNYGKRVDDIFNPTIEDKREPRGLSLVMYQASIEDQFEFLQRHWANSNTRPVAGGDDMIIGLPHRAEKKITIQENVNISTKNMEVFTSPVGMGYFLLPPISAITDVITSKPISDDSIFYDVPAGNKDFEEYQDLKLWDWTVKTVFWQSIWQSANASLITNGGQTSVPSFTADGYPTGIAYRLPNPENDAENFMEKDLANKAFFRETNIQFRSTEDVENMARILGHETGKKELLRARISWEAFPKRLLDLYKNSDINPYEIADEVGWPPKDLTYRSYAPISNARQMDEYCEWFTHRNEEGKIIQIDLTCESPEYWTFLVKNRPDVALKLYQKYVSPKVTLASLLDKFGEYNVYNEWNTEKGAMHLNCPPNSLFAEIYIAAEAATRWGDCENGETLTKGGDLIECASYGLSTRASDPTIGKNCNDLIRSGKIISINNPVGLYLEELDTTGWLNNEKVPFTDDELKDIVKYVRESPCGERKLRIQVKIPDDKGFVLGDCFIGGDPLDFAGQLVDASVTVFLDAIAVDGENDKLRFLSKDVKKAIVPCKDVWGTKGKNGKLLGPQQNIVNPLVKAPELSSSNTLMNTNINVPSTPTRTGR